MNQTNKIILTIVNPDQELLSEEVDVVSSNNTEGPFDVLPMHTNFISIIKDYLWIYRGGSKIKDIKVSSGILRVNSNKVEVFLGIEALEEKGES